MKVNSLVSKYKVLYVEDDNVHREELKVFLRRRVGKLFLASNGQEGLEIFKKERPDIIISDLRMPDMDGIEMSREVRKIDKLVPIIVTTAFSDVETMIDAVDVGIDKYVLKPINTGELVKALDEVAEKIVELGEDDSFIVDGQVINERKERLEYEGKVQVKVAYFLKSNTGKGPKVVKAFISGKKVEVEVSEGITLFEKKLIAKGKNENLVKFCREAFYTEGKEELEETLKEVLKSNCKLEEIEIDLKNFKDYLKFTME